jgi:hypothetical protein
MIAMLASQHPYTVMHQSSVGNAEGPHESDQVTLPAFYDPHSSLALSATLE